MIDRSGITLTAEQERTALAWLSVLHDQPDSGDQATFSRWLQADPAHAEAYARAQVIWELSEVAANTLAGEETLALQRYLSAMDAVPRRRVKRWSAGLAVAASLLLAGVLAGWQPVRWFNDLGADYVSAPGQVRNVILADQSRVTLDADSAIAVNFSGGERHVELRRGVAFFHVTHTGEPFVVDANGGEARVLGTEFEVRLQPVGVQVTVLSGRVGIKPGKNAPQQILTADQQTAYADGAVTGAVQHVDSQARLAWRSGWLSYYKTPLADVVADLKRYYPGQILLLNSQLGTRRISASFPSQDPQAVLDSLQGVLGFEQHTLFGRVIVLR